jgi:hypothetical protein
MEYVNTFASSHFVTLCWLIFASPPQICTTFAIVASIVGASLAPEVVVVSGFAKLFGDAISSMCVPSGRGRLFVASQLTHLFFPSPHAVGMGDAVSEIAEHNYIKGERAREMQETETMLE